MRMTTGFVAPLLAAGAAAIAIAMAPAALADSNDTQQSCTYTSGTNTQCQSPGNVQLNDSPGYIQYGPQYPYWGDEFFGGRGGFSHGGMGGGHR